MEFTYSLRFRFDETNNEAEYEALIAGLKIAEQMGVENLQENVDSRLVANQVNGTYVAKETNMIRYLEKVKTLTSSFKAFLIKHVLRNENKKADALSKIASTSFAHLSKQVLVEELKEKSISAAEVLAVVEKEGDTWMTPIFKYLMDKTLLAEGKKARAVKRKSWRFSIINGILYKKSFLRPWLRHTIRHGKGLADWLLLANHAQGRKKVNSSMPRLPSSQACPKEPSIKVKPNHISVAVLQVSNGDTPFSLTYETEAVIPTKIGMPTLRTAKVSLEENKEALEINLDLLEERREQAAIREAKKQSKDGKVLQL
ncbi:reverse transcriptase domain-containing protein [Tanacetum coccineum]